jgi:hypothetical protein
VVGSCEIFELEEMYKKEKVVEEDENMRVPGFKVDKAHLGDVIHKDVRYLYQ